MSFFIFILYTNCVEYGCDLINNCIQRKKERRYLYGNGDFEGIDKLEKDLLAQNANHKDWECTEEMMKLTKNGSALYLHCLPADITGVSCEAGEVEASVFDRYRDPLYKEASFKPYIIAAMIFLSKVKNPQEILAKLENEKSIEIDKLFNNYKESEKVIEAAVTEQSKSKVVEIKEEPITEPVIEEKVKEEVKVVNEPIQVKESNEILQMDFTMLEKESLLNEIADIEVMTMTPLDAMNKLFKIVQDAKKLKQEVLYEKN